MVKGDKVVCADLGGLGKHVETFKDAKIFTVKSIDANYEHISLEEIEGEFHADRFVRVDMNKIWVVTQQGIPIMAYNQSEVTPLELWEKHLGCSVFDVEVQ